MASSRPMFWTYTEGPAPYENPCDRSRGGVTISRQILARGTWAFDQLNQVLRFFIANHQGEYIFNYFPFALPGAGPRTAITLTHPTFNADKTRFTVRTQDFLAFRSYTRDAESDGQQLCIAGKPRRLDKPGNLEDQGLGVVQLVKEPPPPPKYEPIAEEALVNSSFSMRGYTAGGSYDGENDQIAKVLPRSIRDNVLTLLKRDGKNT